MTRLASTSDLGRGLWHRAAVAVCPPVDRRWIDAMFAEIGAINGLGARIAWLAGVVRLLVASIGAQAGTLPRRHRAASVLALGVLGACAAPAVTGYEGLGTDDDVFLLLASFAGIALVVLGIFALDRIFLHPQRTRGGV